MRVVVPFTAKGRSDLATRALEAYAPDAEYFDVSASDHAYHEFLSRLWRDGADFLVVEHDIEILSETIPSFEACPEPWCLSPYGGPLTVDDEFAPITTGLGCTRFRSSVMAEVPDLLDQVAVLKDNNRGAKDWRLLDSRLYGLLMNARGNEMPHLHDPVLHHHGPLHPSHPYARCACGESHE